MKQSNPADYTDSQYDLITSIALDLADKARAAGRKVPKHGYSKRDWEKAEDIVFAPR